MAIRILVEDRSGAVSGGGVVFKVRTFHAGVCLFRRRLS